MPAEFYQGRRRTVPLPHRALMKFSLSVVSHLISFVKLMCRLQELHCQTRRHNKAALFLWLYGRVCLLIWTVVLVGVSHRWYTNTSHTTGDKIACPKKFSYCGRHKEVRLGERFLLTTMATLLMVTLLPRCAGRHRHAKLWKDGEGSGDWGWRKLSLQTVVCNALWESRSPRTLRRGINQPHARDQESVLCCHTLPPSPPPMIDRCSLSIDWSFFSVISRLQSYHGLRGECYCGPETAIIIVRYNNWTGAAPISHSSDLIYTMY